VNVSNKPKSVRLTEDQLDHISKRQSDGHCIDLSDYIRNLIDADMGVSHKDVVVSAHLLERIAIKIERLEELLESGVAVNKPKREKTPPKRGGVTGTKGAMAHVLNLLNDDED
ncbi:MAG TPA: hypothetical protein PLZ51_29305, partial [Aggregatilineales bacterium]|nr:hypothetical protein [Aggregatilineales bacterium]